MLAIDLLKLFGRTRNGGEPKTLKMICVADIEPIFKILLNAINGCHGWNIGRLISLRL
jgi:hypothetical protein